jgi:hypothetical protein
MDDTGFGHVPHGCVFAKALLAREAQCDCAVRRQVAEASAVDCRSPVAQANCSLLAALLHERARFALKLPPAGRPLMHQQAMRLQCGGLLALQAQIDGAAGEAPAAVRDVHGLVRTAQVRHGSLTDLPWGALVAGLAAWQPRRRRTAR